MRPRKDTDYIKAQLLRMLQEYERPLTMRDFDCVSGSRYLKLRALGELRVEYDIVVRVNRDNSKSWELVR